MTGFCALLKNNVF